MPDNLPSDEIQQPAAERKSSGWAVRHRWAVLGAMLFAQTAFAAVFNPIARGTVKENEIRDDMLIGFILAQAILYAIWAVFAPQRFYVRFLWAFFLATMTTFVVEISELKDSRNELGLLAVYHAVIFFTVIGGLSFVKRFSGWKFRSVEENEAADGYLARQFGIKHIILLITITALALGLFQSLTALCPKRDIPDAGDLFQGGLIVVLILSPVIFIPWFFLSSRNANRRDQRSRYGIFFIPRLFVRRGRLWISLPISACLFWGILEAAVCSTVTELGGWLELRGIVFYQLGAVISLSIAAFTLRRCGYRLERVRKNSQGG